jgi:uncharacterized protein DUF5329
MKRLLTTAVASLWFLLASGAPTPATVRAEIDALLAKLQASGCQFNRNGSWYSGSKAKDHLLGKLEYFESKGSIQSAEQFIELAASKSSSSGKAYQVKCGGESAVASQVWLTQQLAAMRATAGKGKP